MKSIKLLMMTVILTLFLVSCTTTSSERSLNILEEAISLEIGETYQLNITVDAPEATYTQIKSVDTLVATVSEDGLVTAVGLGVTFIQIRNGLVFDYVVVSVGSLDSEDTIQVVFVDTYNETTDVVSYQMNQALVLPESPTYDGYTFVEWRTSLNQSNSAVTAGTQVTDDLILFAYFKDASLYTISFETKIGDPIDSFELAYGETFTLPDLGDVENYLFSAWQYNHALNLNLKVVYETAQAGDEITVTGDMKFYAKFLYSIPLSAYTFEEVYSEWETLTGYIITDMDDTNAFDIYRNSSALESIELPSEFEGLPVYGVEYLFANDVYYFDEVIIPEGYLYIGNETFLESSIQTLTIPDSLINIYSDAFLDSRISEIVISEHSKLQYIESSAFQNSKGFNSFYVPENLYVIDSSAFENTDLNQLIFHPNANLRAIYDSAFASTPLRTLVLPNKLEYIGRTAFENTLITTLDIPSSVNYIDEYAFFNDTLTSVSFEEGFNPYYLGNLFINSDGFSFDDNHLLIRDNVLIAYDKNVSNFDLIIPEEVTHIATHAFSYTLLNSITFPSQLIYLGDYALSSSTIVASNNITLPNTLRFVGRDAFSSSIFSDIVMTLPGSVENYGSRVFFGTSGIREVIFKARNTTENLYFQETFSQALIETVTLEEGYEGLGYNFLLNSQVETINLPSTIKYLHSNALYNSVLVNVNVNGSLNIESFSNDLNSFSDVFNPLSPYIANQVDLGYKVFENVLYEYTLDGPFVAPQGVTYITYYAVGVSPTTIDLTGVKHIESYAFYNTPADATVTIDNDAKVYYSFTYSGYNQRKVNYVVNDTGFYGHIYEVVDGKDLIYLPLHNIFESMNPASLPAYDPDGFIILGTTVLAYQAPLGFDGSVTIPEGITDIMPGVFYNKNITSVAFPSTLQYIGHNAFGNNQITSISLPVGLKALGQSVFRNNQLTSITFPNTLEYIGYAAFQYNQITSLYFPKSVTYLGDGLFRGNPLIKDQIDFEDPTTLVYADDVFEDTLFEDDFLIIDGVLFAVETLFESFGILDLVIPEGVTVLATNALQGMLYNTVTLPSTLEKLTNQSLRYVEISKLIFAENSIVEIDENAFYGSSIFSVTNPPLGYDETYFIMFND